MGGDTQDWVHNMKLARIAVVCACVAAASTIAVGRLVFARDSITPASVDPISRTPDR